MEDILISFLMAFLFLASGQDYVYQCCIITIIMMAEIRKKSIIVLSILIILLYETHDYVINGSMIHIIQIISVLCAMMILNVRNRNYFKFIPMVMVMISSILYIKLLEMGIHNLNTIKMKSATSAIPVLDGWLANNFAVIFFSMIEFSMYVD
jgi:hypothetical protein